jgi:signal transduction histidine kinase
MRTDFVANASHELRTPLFSLGGFLELMMDEDLDEETRRGFLVTMQGQVERLAKLSIDLLDLSRVDAGQLTVVQEPVDLCDAARALAAELEHIASSSGHVLEVVAEGEVWSLADEDRVLQIGRALVSNALVHTPAGTRVVIRGHRRGSRALLSVEDDGPGIPPDQREAVFERFYRGEGTIAPGSGLGLAIARELARLMQGAVRLEPGDGRTVFTLDLPVEPAPSRVPATAFSRENGAAPGEDRVPA